MRISFRVIGACVVMMLLFALLLSLPAAQSQSDSPACTSLVEQALTSLAQNCAGADGNSACYGFGGVEASFAYDSAASSFDVAGSQVDLSAIQSLHTMGLNVDAEQWGIAMMNVPANVPRALSAQGLRFILLGDVEVENAVAPEDVFAPADAIDVTSVVGANLRASASTEGKVIGNAPVGATLQVDGLSADGAWLRVLQPDSVAWISKQVVAVPSGSSLDTLPVIRPTSRTLMQTFYLRTATDDSACSAAPPSMLVIQGPPNVPATITVNGADIRISSTIVLRVLPENIMQLIAISGGAHSGGVSVPPGFTMTVQLDAEGTGLAGLWTGLRPITPEERAALTPLEALPTNLLAYAIKIPTAAEVAAIQASLSGGATASGAAAGKVDCRRLRLTHPLDAVQAGQGPWYWDGAPGATEYRINFFSGGSPVASFTTGGQNTTYTVDSSGFGGSVSWNVEALYNGQVACSTPQITVQLIASAQPVGGNTGPTAPLPTPTKCGWKGC